MIERLWKFMRKKVINTRHYERFEDFEAAIKQFFENIASQKDELESLMTLKFQILKPAPKPS